MTPSKKIQGNAAEIDQLLPGQDYHSTWASPEAFGRYIASKDPNKDTWGEGSHIWTDNSSFYGGPMSEALELSQKGWAEGTERVEHLRSRVLASNPLRKQLVKYDVAGVTPCIARAVAGDIKNMKAPDLAKSKRRNTITLLCHMGANCMVEAEHITNRAAVLAAIIDQIEASGYSCEIISSAKSNSYSDFKVATSVLVKQSGQPVDTARLSYALGHASMFRRLVFADRYTEKSCERGLGEGLGCTRDFEVDQEALRDKNIFLIPHAGKRPQLFEDEETAATKGLEYLLNELRKQKCPAIPGPAIPDEKETLDF